jgi:hypothetical protein
MPDPATEDLGRGNDAAPRNRSGCASDPDAATPARRVCTACERELLDEELTCPPCWLRATSRQTGLFRAAFASIVAMVRR